MCNESKDNGQGRYFPQAKSKGMTLKSFRSRTKTSTKTYAKGLVALLIMIAWSMTGPVGISQAKKPSHTLTVQNDSGQFVLVKIVGPTRAVLKVPLDQKKKAHLASGKYYILVRFGFAPKEYIYTKGEAFTLTQEQDRFSHTSIILHRVVAGIENPHEVSGKEFETKSAKKASLGSRKYCAS